ncbi:OadG-related small transporter subunit [Butyricicoccus sp. Marseille-Q5471]|nr:OadG-related small transporter subunit [Butyricicoccus sp. Marseille-Q5471]
MEANLAAAIELLGRGMAGIFTVLIIIALTVALLGRLDSNKQG